MPLRKAYGAVEDDDDDDSHAVTSKWYHIDVETLPAKFCYFFIGMKDSSYLPYLILYFTSVGLSITQAGVIAGTRLFGMLIGAPIWGMVDDMWRQSQFLVLLLCLISSALMVQMPFVAASIEHNAPMCLSWSNKTGSLTSNQSCNSSTSSNYSCCGCAVVSQNKVQFWFHLIVSIIMMFFDGALVGLNDSAVMSMIQGSARKMDFGWQRVFGSAGYSMGALVTSLLIKYFPNPYPGISRYWPAFFVYAFAVVCYAGSTMLLSRVGQVKAPDRKCHERRFVAVVFRTMARFDVFFFLVTAFVMGIFLGMTNGFTFKLMADLKSPDLLMGMSVVMGTAGSIILFAFTTKLIFMLGGPLQTMGLAAFVYCVRFVVYGFASSPYVIFGIQVLHCFAYAPFIASAVMYVHLISPKEVLSTMYSITNGLHFGAGSILAQYLGGLVYERLGGPWLFRATAVFNMFWVSIIVIYVLRESCWKVKKANLESERRALITNTSTSEC